MDTLRQQAIALGIDPTPFGEDLDALRAAIQAAGRPPKMRYGAAISAPREVQFTAEGNLIGWPPPVKPL